MKKGLLHIFVLALLCSPLSLMAQQVSTFAGTTGDAGFDLTATDKDQVHFDSPYDIAVDPDGNIYITDWANHSIKMIRPDGTVYTRGGAGAAGYAAGGHTNARFNFPEGLAIASDGTVYVADAGNHIIREITPFEDVSLQQQVNTIAGDAFNTSSGYVDGGAFTARFNDPSGLAIKDGSLFVADRGNHVIRKINLSTGQVTTHAGQGGVAGSDDGTLATATFNRPSGIIATDDGLIVTELGGGDGRRIRKLSNGQVTTIAGGNTNYSTNGFFFPIDVVADADGNLYVTDRTMIKKVTADTVEAFAGVYNVGGTADGVGTNARFAAPYGLAMSSDRQTMYVTDFLNHNIRIINMNVTSQDTIAPVITMIGEDTMCIDRCDGVIDPGVTVSDDQDPNPLVITVRNVDSCTVGEYTITYTARDAEGNETVAERVITVKDNCTGTGMGEQPQQHVDVYPNPAQDQLFIDTEGQDVLVRIYNLQGQEVLTQQSKGSMSLSSLHNGTYLLLIEQDGQLLHRQLVVKQ